jgi:hydroxypyruvate isomerase
MWADLPLADRARRAAEAGFDSVELWDWRGEDLEALHRACNEGGIGIAGFFGHSRGGLADSSQHDEVLRCLAESIEIACQVGARQLLMFSDEIRPDSTIRQPPSHSNAERREMTVAGLRRCIELIEGKEIDLVIESINTVFVPGYFLNDTSASIDICRAVNHPQVRMFFDCFHQQLVGGRLIENMIAALPWVAAIHVADVPGRHQPGTGEINFLSIRRVLEEQGYNGQLTFEVDPLGGDSEAAVAAIKEVFPF